MKTLTLPLLGLIFFLLSCSEDSTSPALTIDDYTNLEVGNYWVYEWQEITPDGVESSFNKTDRLSIVSDTVIADRNYFVRKGTFLGNERTELLFDSARSLYLYPSRDLLFTLDATQQVNRDIGPSNHILAQAEYSLVHAPVSATVPAGNFECLNFEGKITATSDDYQHGTRLNSHLYADQVGLVLMRTQFFQSPNDLEMRLVEFGNQ